LGDHAPSAFSVLWKRTEKELELKALTESFDSEIVRAPEVPSVE
jgi:hypothetical protein